MDLKRQRILVLSISALVAVALVAFLSISLSHGRETPRHHSRAIKLKTLPQFPIAAVPIKFGGNAFEVTLADSLPVSNVIRALDCPSEKNCFALLSDSNFDPEPTYLLTSADGGKSWSRPTKVNSLYGIYLDGVSCPTPLDCFGVASSAFSDRQVRVVSKDAGRTWSKDASTIRQSHWASLNSPTEVCITSRVCLLINNGIRRTVDHGENWKQIKLPHYSNLEIQAVSCSSSSKCVAGAIQETGDGGALFASVDQGLTWKLTSTFSNWQPFSMSCLPDACISLGIGQPRKWEALRITASGKSAEMLTIPQADGGSNYNSVCAGNSFCVIPPQSNGRLFVSEGDLTTWLAVPFPADTGVSDPYIYCSKSQCLMDGSGPTGNLILRFSRR